MSSLIYNRSCGNDITTTLVLQKKTCPWQSDALLPAAARRGATCPDNIPSNRNISGVRAQRSHE